MLVVGGNPHTINRPCGFLLPAIAFAPGAEAAGSAWAITLLAESFAEVQANVY